MDTMLLLRLLALLAVANGAPVLTANLLGARFSFPLDFGIRFTDGRPLLGPSKTIRGLAASLVAAPVAAPFLGLDWRTGLLVAGFAMLGDVFSSFVKRRLGKPPSARATGLDQIPESLFPLAACAGPLDLTAADVAVGTALFFFGELLLSRILYKLRLRDRPY